MIFYVIRPMFRPCRLQMILAAFSTYPPDKSRAVPFPPEPSGRFCGEARTLQDFRVKIVRNRQEGAKISEENTWRTQIAPDGARIRGISSELEICRALNEYARSSAARKSKKNPAPKSIQFLKGEVT